MTGLAYIKERAAAHQARVADNRQRNRGEFPNVAQIVDEVRKFFPNAKLLHGVEPDGREVGKTPDYLKEPTA